MKIKFPKTDRILGVSAMVISILTLIIFIYQTEIINEQSKLSVKPHLSFHLNQTGNDSLITFTQTLTNKGLGPAIIKEAHIIFKENEFPLYVDLFLSNTYPNLDNYASLISSTGLINYTIISPNETVVLYSLQVPVQSLSEFLNYLEINENDVNGTPNWNFEIGYTSMYEDELWSIDDKTNVPTME